MKTTLEMLSGERNVTLNTLLNLARELRSEHGENPEYDRALVELCCDAAGLPMNYKQQVAKLIGVKYVEERETS